MIRYGRCNSGIFHPKQTHGVIAIYLIILASSGANAQEVEPAPANTSGQIDPTSQGPDQTVDAARAENEVAATEPPAQATVPVEPPPGDSAASMESQSPAAGTPASEASHEPTASDTPPSTPDSDKLKIELGVRVGYGLPYGEIAADAQLEDRFMGSIPLQIDVLLRHRSGFAAGVYGQLAPGIRTEAAIDACKECSALTYSFGLQAAMHFNPGGIVDPWLGAGVGVEGIVSSLDDPYLATQYGLLQQVPARYSFTQVTIPQLSVQAGVDFGTDSIAFGPYVSGSWATASTEVFKIECADSDVCGDTVFTEDSAEISPSDRGSHYWVQFGVRGAMF